MSDRFAWPMLVCEGPVRVHGFYDHRLPALECDLVSDLVVLKHITFVERHISVCADSTCDFRPHRITSLLNGSVKSDFGYVRVEGTHKSISQIVRGSPPTHDLSRVVRRTKNRRTVRRQ